MSDYVKMLDEVFKHSPAIHNAVIRDAQKWWAAVAAKQSPVEHFVTLKYNNGNYFATCTCGFHICTGRTTNSIAVDRHLQESR